MKWNLQVNSSISFTYLPVMHGVEGLEQKNSTEFLSLLDTVVDENQELNRVFLVS